MGHITAAKDVAAPANQVWAVISDPTRWDSWLTIHAGWIEEPPTELGVGSKLLEKIVMLGMANKLEWTIEAIEPGVSISMSGKGMAGVTADFRFSIVSNGDGTAVTIDAAFAGSLIIGALGKAVEKDAAKNLDESLEKLAATASA